jgi:hypothetical protein
MSRTIAQNGKKKGFTMISNELIDEHLEHLTRAEGFVFLVLARKAINGIANVDQQYIAKRVGCSRREIQRAINRLVDLHLIRSKSAKAQGQANRYELLLKVERGYDTHVVGGYDICDTGGTTPTSPNYKDSTKTKTSERPVPKARRASASEGRSAALSRKRSREADRLWADEMMALYAYDDKPKLLQ